MSQKICLKCNNKINKNQQYEEFLDNSVTKILRSRKYSGLWIHKDCATFNESLIKKTVDKKNNKNKDTIYYQKLKTIIIGKKKYLFDIDNTIAYYYRSSPETFKKQKTSSYVLDNIVKKDIFNYFSVKRDNSNIQNYVLKINSYIDKKILNVNQSFKDKFKPIRNIF